MLVDLFHFMLNLRTFAVFVYVIFQSISLARFVNFCFMFYEMNNMCHMQSLSISIDFPASSYESFSFHFFFRTAETKKPSVSYSTPMF